MVLVSHGGSVGFLPWIIISLVIYIVENTFKTSFLEIIFVKLSIFVLGQFSI